MMEMLQSGMYHIFRALHFADILWRNFSVYSTNNNCTDFFKSKVDYEFNITNFIKHIYRVIIKDTMHFYN